MASADVQTDPGDECAVCQDAMSDPRVLPCRHVYCRGCLYSWRRAEGLQGGITCPECREETRFLPGEGVGDLPSPPGYTRQGVRPKHLTPAGNTSNTGTGNVVRHCGVCACASGSDVTPGSNDVTGPVAVTFCQSCVKDLCLACMVEHRSGRYTRNHLLIQLSPRAMCGNHPREISTFYCRACNTGMCLLCLRHGNHDDVIDIHDVTDRIAVLRSQRAELGRTLETLHVRREDVEMRKYELDRKRRLYTKWQDGIQGKLQYICTQHSDDVTERACAELKHLHILEDDLTEVIGTRENVMQHIDDVINKGGPHDVMTMSDLGEVKDAVFPEIPDTRLDMRSEKLRLLERLSVFIQNEISYVETDEDYTLLRHGDTDVWRPLPLPTQTPRSGKHQGQTQGRSRGQIQGPLQGQTQGRSQGQIQGKEEGRPKVQIKGHLQGQSQVETQGRIGERRRSKDDFKEGARVEGERRENGQEAPSPSTPTQSHLLAPFEPLIPLPTEPAPLRPLRLLYDWFRTEETKDDTPSRTEPSLI